MTPLPERPVVLPFYTGRSSFLQANRYLAAAMMQAASRCEIQSSEDIHDANGVMLWASQRRIGPALMARLADRKLAKPIELCVAALDPVSTLALVTSLDALCHRSPDFALLIAPHRDDLLQMLMQLEFDAQQLLLLSVLRFGGCDRLTHALAVGAIGVVASRWFGLDRQQQGKVLRAGLLHDVGRLYLPDPPSGTQADSVQQRHPTLGALCVAELTSCEPVVAELIAQSHERVNGLGYPQGLRGTQLSRSSQALAFAEAIARHLCQIGMGAQRAAMCSRLVPGEFAPELTSGASALARDAAIGAVCQCPADRPARVGLALRHLHAELSRVVVLLSMPFGEDDLVREAAATWLTQVNPLMRALRYSGVEDTLAQGFDIQPSSPQEHGEMAALHAELADRAHALFGVIEARCRRSATLADSRLVSDTRRRLASACSAPPPAPPH